MQIALNFVIVSARAINIGIGPKGIPLKSRLSPARITYLPSAAKVRTTSINSCEKNCASSIPITSISLGTNDGIINAFSTGKAGIFPPSCEVTKLTPRRTSIDGLKTIVGFLAITVLERRLISSPDFPENIGPQITSICPLVGIWPIIEFLVKYKNFIVNEDSLVYTSNKKDILFFVINKGLLMSYDSKIQVDQSGIIIPQTTFPHLLVKQSLKLEGTATLVGAKNATLVIIISLLLTKGKSTLFNVPALEDTFSIIELMNHLGAHVQFDIAENVLQVDTTHIENVEIPFEIMNKCRASFLVLGALLARFNKAAVGLPGGCVIGERPIDYHVKNFEKMGVTFQEESDVLRASVKELKHRNLLLEYPSVGATENLVLAAVLTEGTTRIINAALEPEVFDFIEVLKKMGAQITIEAPATLCVKGVKELTSVEYTIMYDRLEAGALLLAGAITGGYIDVPQAPAHAMGLFLTKLQDMGHTILIGKNGIGVKIKASKRTYPVTIKTAPYPSFPTDLQAPITAALVLTQGTSKIQETVFENRLMHIKELVKMGAQAQIEHSVAIIRGVQELYGTTVIASDIRASCALVLAGLAAQGTTIVTGIHHWKRGYQNLEKKLQQLGAQVDLYE